MSAPPSASDDLRCPSCGESNAPGVRFCGHCGKRIDAAAAMGAPPPPGGGGEGHARTMFMHAAPSPRCRRRRASS